ncbi:MAG: hypothetical protein FJX75_06825 [Armatimonadetes bacterium]|nr:hypothetical protein [Armatimonadota bacterium]
MPLEDKQLRRRCEREIAKFPLDLTRTNVRALNNIIYLEGRIRIMRGSAGASGANLDKLIENIRDVLMQMSDVREVNVSNLIRDY